MQSVRLEEVESREVVPGYVARFVHSEHVTLAFWEVEPGAALPRHAHPHEQVAHVLEGRFRLTVGDETRVMEAGDVVVIPSEVEHEGQALTRCRLLDVFHPPRDDYR